MPADQSRSQCWRDLAAIMLLLAFVSTIYGARIGRQPIVGEESRWATGAREMLATGDWVVPRQQGRIFPERPPMTMWAIAVSGWLRGDVDSIAIRLPSVVAVALTSLLVYGYTRSATSPVAALAAGLVYATFGQVLQIGRLGESEALFALLVSASLLLWHWGYRRGWSKLATWTCGFGLAAVAALVKGPQAPVYFVSITAAYLLVLRDWRFLVGWQYAAGAIVFAAILAAWQIPFYLATNWQAVVATWSGLATDRVHVSGLARHVLTYPFETFICLLPWSPLLIVLLKKEVRGLLGLSLPWPSRCKQERQSQPVALFLVTAIAVAYPTVWIAAGARGRYFMPLYPIVAVLIGILIERCAMAPLGEYPRRAWHQFLLLCGVAAGIGGLVVGSAGLFSDQEASWLYQPRWFSMLFAAAAAGAAYAIWRCYRLSRPTPIAAVAVIAAFAGTAYAGIMINVNAARWNDLTGSMARFRELMPWDESLVSLSPIDHRFAYYYEAPVAEVDWPLEADDLPNDVEYFCFMRHPDDTAEQRAAGRGRTWTTTPGTLPFEWEEIGAICVERRVRESPQPMVVLGRVTRVRGETTPSSALSRSDRPQPGENQPDRLGRRARAGQIAASPVLEIR